MIKTHRLTVVGLWLVTLAVAALTTRPALAVSGTVWGTISVEIRNGGYCPNSRDCTGAMYVQQCPPGVLCRGAYGEQTQYDAQTRVKNARVYLYSEGAGFIGWGHTNDGGYYNISWSYGGYLPHPDQSYVLWIPMDNEDRLRVTYSDGSFRGYASPTFYLLGGTDPRFIGDLQFGADDWNNSYWGAAAAWRTNLMYSGAMMDRYYVEIRGFTSGAIPGWVDGCPDSCMVDEHRIVLDEGAGFSPQARVMHEMGHAAIRTEKPWNVFYNGYTYGGDPFGFWGYDTHEWKAAAWEEAHATFLGDTTLYYPNAPQPYSCSAPEDTACYDYRYNLEIDDLEPACSTDEGRHPVSGMRMLWDIYDDVPDGNDNICEGCATWWRMWDVLSGYADGTGYNQVNEPWNNAQTTWTEPDGRSGFSYLLHYYSTYGVFAVQPWVQNCQP